VLEIHPWGSTLKDLERPDRITFDLDPGEDVAWDALTVAAREVRERLGALGLESFLKTTGGKGLHVVAPLTPHASWEEVKAFAQSIAEAMTHDSPARYTDTLSKRARTGRIFVDYLRNGRGATAVGAYSTRARPGAPVSTPLAWPELDAQRSANAFRVDNLLARLDHLKHDPWTKIGSLAQTLPKPARGARRRSR
jgi:bifunctional non-homologous end joining protein LigD